MPRRKPKQSLLSLALTLVGAGLMLLLVPAMLGSHPIFAAFKAGLHTPAWWAIGLGAVLGVLHLATTKLGGKAKAPALRPPAAPARSPRQPAASYDQAAVRRILKTDDAPTEPILAPAPPATATPTPTPAAPALAPAHERLTRWRPEVFAAIEWRRFEAVCEALFAQAGFETRAQSHGPDGGVDIWLHSRNAAGPVAVVQCKHWQGKPVPVAAMREFLGVMAHHKLARGTYATSSTFTPEALAFAQANGINALDGTRLLEQIARRTPEQQAALLVVAFEGEYWRPTCPSCGVKMVKPRGQKFWGCPNYRTRGCRSKIYKAAGGAYAAG